MRVKRISCNTGVTAAATAGDTILVEPWFRKLGETSAYGTAVQGTTTGVTILADSAAGTRHSTAMEVESPFADGYFSLRLNVSDGATQTDWDGPCLVTFSQGS
jgi:hypothetical protein